MKLSQLRIFVAVADMGSFSAAAAELGCTQSRISHAIAELERLVGARLLNRSHAGSVPTVAGHKALEQAKQMLRLERDLIETAKGSQQITASVRIACFRSVGTHLLPYSLEALGHEYPGIRVDIDDGFEDRDDITRAVEEGRADLGIAQLPVQDKFVVAGYLHDSYVFVVPARLGLRAPLSWSQLEALPFIQLNCSGAASIVRQCRAAGFTAEAARTLTNDTSIAAMVARGMGYSILPRLAAFPHSEEVNIIDLPIGAKRHLALIALPETMRSKAVKIVRQFIGDKRIVGKSKAFQAGVVHFD